MAGQRNVSSAVDSHRPPSLRSATLVPPLLSQRLWIVTGKGGVGRSTLSAALSLAASRRGKRTLVCELNTQERIAPMLGHAPVGPTVTRVEPNLWTVDIRPEDALHEYGLMILKFEPLYRAVFENRIVRHFLRFVPSIQELVMLGKALFHVQAKRSCASRCRTLAAGSASGVPRTMRVAAPTWQ